MYILKYYIRQQISVDRLLFLKYEWPYLWYLIKVMNFN